MLSIILKEPLVYFIVFAAFIYAWNTPNVSEQELTANTIALPSAFVNDQKLRFQQKFQRLPTPQELDSLLEQAVNEEILFREAWRLQLFVGDEVVRKRMIQKMRFILDQDETEPAITQEQIALKRAQLKARAPEYTRDTLEFDLYHLVFATQQSANDYLHELAGGNTNPSTTGKDIIAFPLGNVFQQLTVKDAARMFGQDFAAQLDIQLAEQWQGPVKSRYGFHIVKLDDVNRLTPTARHASQDAIRQDIIRADIEQKRRKAIDALRSRYVIAYAE
jgi:parvulin-like peptidyl-prolyl isomerase